VRLRYFSINDLPAVFDLACNTLKERYSPTLFLNLRSYWPEGFIVLEEMGRIQGFVLGVMSSRIQARLLMVAVSEPARRRGLGTLLLREFQSECAKRGARYITLEVRKSNLPAIMFYERMGFQIVGDIRRYYSDGEDAYRMHLFS